MRATLDVLTAVWKDRGAFSFKVELSKAWRNDEGTTI
jgi:hypothetical protein